MRWILLVLLLGSVMPVAYGQLVYNYAPRGTYDRTATDLITQIKNQTRRQYTVLEGSGKPPGIIKDAKAEMSKSTRMLVSLVEHHLVILDDTLHRWVDDIVNTIVAANALKRKPQTVLVMKSTTCNAYSVGEGTIVVTTALLASMRTDSELAFTLAHEMAHEELEHASQRLFYKVEQRRQQKSNKVIRQAALGEVTTEAMDTLRSLAYAAQRYSREHEMQADSLGLILMHRAGYDTWASFGALSAIDSGDYTKERLGRRLFKPFEFATYPFQEYWLSPPLTMYTRRPQDTYFFSVDSLQSHPDMLLRQKTLLVYLPSNVLQDEYPSPEVQHTIALAAFASLEAGYDFKRMDQALLRALELKHRYPRNVFVTSSIARIFIKLYRWKDYSEQLFRAHVPLYVAFYGEELKSVNTFLNNLTLQELGELGFQFLNNKDNFNPACRDHYILLWHICDQTRRYQVAAKVKENYEKRFGRDLRYAEMKSGAAKIAALEPSLFLPSGKPRPQY
jgi:Zn-dependent protease with chaperone function